MQTNVETPKVSIGDGLKIEKMPGHWLLARLGKRILRPGGREATEWLIEKAAPNASDEVIEFAPGLGITARRLLAHGPRSYVGVERDAAAAATANRAIAALGSSTARVLQGDASRVPLDDACASLVVGEAMLSMQPESKKAEIVGEAARLLRPGGRYALHEMAVRPGTPAEVRERIQKDLSGAIHVGVRIGTPEDWTALLERAGFEVRELTTLPMRLLEFDRLVADEGVFGVARMAVNAVRTPGAIARLKEMRQNFRKHADSLCAIAIVADRAA